MAINKKGLFFTLTSIIFVLLMILFIKVENKPLLSEKDDMINSRVNTMNEFISSVEQDIERSLYISGFRAILSMNDYILLNGEYINNVDLRFEEAIFNGTLNGEPNVLITGSTFNDWISSISANSNKLNIIVDFQNPTLAIYQDNPWEIKINLNITINYEDIDNIAAWNRSAVIETSINISNFEDPLYIVETFGRISNPIIRTPYEGNYTSNIEGVWDVTNLRDHVKNSYYTSHSDAPSYLMRLEGNISQASSCCGIESLVDLEDLSDQGIEIYEFSVVDHKYWTNQSGSLIKDMQTWFRLDTDHKSKYEVDDPYFTV